MRITLISSAIAVSIFTIGSLTGSAAQAQLQNPCPAAWAGDGDCDEPNGLNLCAWRTDPIDCSNPNSNYGTGAGFAHGVYAGTTPQRPVPQPPGGTTGVHVSSGVGGSHGCPNWATNRTAFGGTTLWGGFGNFRVPRITAGGRYSLQNCFGTNWRGYTITRPDYRMVYQGGSPTGRLTFRLDSNRTDTILLINAPDGQWYYNDDANGVNSMITFNSPLQGQYDIWAGSYNNSSNNAAVMWIQE